MHVIDFIILLFFLISLLAGALLGIWRIVTGIFSLAFSLFLSYNLSFELKTILPKSVPFRDLVSFFLIFSLSITLLSIFFRIGEKAIKGLGLSFLNRILGALLFFIVSILITLWLIHLLDSLSLSYLLKGTKIPEILVKIESLLFKKYK